MKKAILILLTVLLAVSCSQVVYDKLPPEDISTNGVTFQVKRVTGQNNALEIMFTPVAYVSTYGYQIDNNDSVAISSGDFGYENGYITYSVIDSNFDNTGVISLLSMADGGDTVIATANYSFDTTSDVAPDVIVSSRYENYVELYVSAIDPEIEYKIEVKDNTTQSEFEFERKAENRIITVPGLVPDHTYTLTVAHKSADDESYGEKTASLDVGEYEYRVVISLEVTDDAFIAREIPEGMNSVSLRKNSDNEEKYKEILNAEVNNGTAVFNFSDMKSLESGLFYVYAEDASDKYISNTVSATTPIILKGKTENYRSVDLYIDFADDVKNDDSMKFSVIGLTGVTASIQDFTSDEGYDVLTISGIDSNTTYDNISFTANKAGSFAVSSVVENVTTKSFAGKSFEWNGTLIPGLIDVYNGPKDTNFVISVESSVKGSKFPYYVYFNDSDDFIKTNNLVGSNIRIMPLADDSVTNDIDESKINDAYKYNSKKWNSSGITPETWTISDTKPSKNSVLTITSSDSGLVGMVDTATTFEFNETRDENNYAIPYVKFKNTGYGSSGEVVKFGLYSNKAFNTEYEGFETGPDPDAKYCWYLTLVDLSEGGAE